MIKKLILGVVGLVLFLVSALYLWLQFPAVKDPAYIDAVLARSQARLEKLQKLAQSPDTNGYFQPELLPFWGEGGDRKEGCEAEQIITKWAAYSDMFNQEVVDHAKLWRERDSDYLEALKDFEALMPSFKESLDKPIHATRSPRQRQPGSARFIELRTLAMALAATSEARLAAGRHEEALEPLKLCWRFYPTQLNQGELNGMVGSLFRQYANFILVEEISPEDPVFAEAWLEAAEILSRTQPGPEAFSALLEDEIFDLVWSLENPAPTGNGPQGSSLLSFLEEPFMRRFARLSKNAGTEVLKSLRPDTKISRPTWVNQPNDWDFVRGKGSFFIAMSFPGWERLSQQSLHDRAESAALATCAGLFAYRVRHGDLPETLEHLRSLGLEPDPSFPWDSMEYRPPDTLSIRCIARTPSAQDESAEGSWMKVTPEGLEFQLTGVAE